MNKEEILQELEIEIQKILAPYFIILDGRDDTKENEELIEISQKIISKVSENYISKAEVKEKINEVEERLKGLKEIN